MNNMLHTKLLLSSMALLMTLSQSSFAADLELKPISDLSSSYQVARACFLPDCGEDIGDINININNDTRWCEKKGYTYYSSGKCPEYYLLDGTCKKDSNYLKCDGDKWCKNNGYSKTACASTQTLDTVCPNNLPYYKNCKCNSEFRYYSGNCSGNNKPEGTSCASSGTGTGLDTKTYYNQCNCYPTPPNANYSYTCTGSEVQADGCGRYYHRCCSDTCSRGSKSYSGSSAGKTECGTPCYYCKDCTSGSTSYSGSYVGWSECGSCYRCSDTCSRGTRGGVSCSGNYRSTYVASTECGSGCYECQYNSDCDVTSKSCSYGCASSNSCGRCTSCKAKPAEKWIYYIKYIRSSEGSEAWQQDRCLDYNPNYTGNYNWVVRIQSICKNDQTGEEQLVYTTDRCVHIGTSYKTREECVAKEPSGSSNAIYNTYKKMGECIDRWTTSNGRTSVDDGKCVL